MGFVDIANIYDIMGFVDIANMVVIIKLVSQ